MKDVWPYVAKINGPFTVAEVAEKKAIEPALLGKSIDGMCLSRRSLILEARLLRHVSSMGYLTEVDKDTYEVTNFIRSMAFPFIHAAYPCM